MSEKVLGFKEKEAMITKGFGGVVVRCRGFVPVVGLKWLEDYCGGNSVSRYGGQSFWVEARNLLSAAKKEASKTMSFYKCGHDRTTCILDNSPLSISAWLTWKDSAGFDGNKSQCWNCWNKEIKEAEEK